MISCPSGAKQDPMSAPFGAQVGQRTSINASADASTNDFLPHLEQHRAHAQFRCACNGTRRRCLQGVFFLFLCTCFWLPWRFSWDVGYNRIERSYSGVFHIPNGYFLFFCGLSGTCDKKTCRCTLCEKRPRWGCLMLIVCEKFPKKNIVVQNSVHFCFLHVFNFC